MLFVAKYDDCSVRIMISWMIFSWHLDLTFFCCSLGESMTKL